MLLQNTHDYTIRVHIYRIAGFLRGVLIFAFFHEAKQSHEN